MATLSSLNNDISTWPLSHMGLERMLPTDPQWIKHARLAQMNRLECVYEDRMS